MSKDTWMYVALGAAAVAAYYVYKHNKLVSALKAPDNATSLASASLAVKKELGLA